jgi:hypothetical protein
MSVVNAIFALTIIMNLNITAKTVGAFALTAAAMI